MKTFGLTYEVNQLTPIIMKEFKFTKSISKLIAKRLYELARDIRWLKHNVDIGDEQFNRLNELVAEANDLAEELGTTIIHASAKAGYGFILVLPSGNSNNIEGLGWEIYRWKQYFVDKKKTIDMNGLSWS